jgi:hypothetical protein
VPVDLPGELAGFDYRQHPLGSLHGEEHLQAPFNLRPVNAIVRVRNMSAMVERRVVKEAISIRRGGSLSITDGPYKNQRGVSVDALRFKVAEGENMNWEVMQVSPQDALLRLDGKRYLIEYPRDTSKPQIQIGVDPLTRRPVLDYPAKMGAPGEWVAVEAGLWDLYCGNWERMHAASQRERIEELQQLAGRGMSKWVVGDDNPYGYLEFSRTEIRVDEAVVDVERMRSGMLIEI